MLFGTRTFFVLTQLDFWQPTVAVHTHEILETPIKNTVRLNLYGPGESTPDTKLLNTSRKANLYLTNWLLGKATITSYSETDWQNDPFVHSFWLVLLRLSSDRSTKAFRCFRKTNQQFLFPHPPSLLFTLHLLASGGFEFKVPVISTFTMTGT